MELNEKIRKYRKEGGLSQEQLASKIFVSRTLITKYESGSVFPTDENLEKLATVFGINGTELLSDEEKISIIEKSYMSNYRLWTILSISSILVSILLLIFSVVPFYQYSSYDYSNVSIQNPTPVHVTGYVSILAATLKKNNPISIFYIVLSMISVILSTLNFGNLENNPKRILRISSAIVLGISLIVFFFSLGSMISILQSNDFQMNLRI
ncbi:MAG: helix-turn-helix transcriptional regulator [Bacilli bacterium]|jgi:transcriptional regulator with XRE-family HTH domain|nr:helix-turn-helix transcriptional regulator [Bacilli bacterium]